MFQLQLINQSYELSPIEPIPISLHPYLRSIRRTSANGHYCAQNLTSAPAPPAAKFPRHINFLPVYLKSQPNQLFPKKKPHNHCASRKERRPSEAMTCLKSQLATLKEEIGRLMEVEEQIQEDSRRYSFGNNTPPRGFEDKHERSTASVTQTVVYHGHRESDLQNPQKWQIQNESLRLQIQKLEAKLTFERGDYSQQIFSLRMKIQQLESEEVESLKERVENGKKIQATLKEAVRMRDKEMLSKEEQIEKLSSQLQRMMGVVEEREGRRRRGNEEGVELRKTQSLLIEKQSQLKQLEDISEQYNLQRQQLNRFGDLLQKTEDQLSTTRRLLTLKDQQLTQLKLLSDTKHNEILRLDKLLNQNEQQQQRTKQCVDRALKEFQERSKFDEEEIKTLQQRLQKREEEMHEQYMVIKERNDEIQKWKRELERVGKKEVELQGVLAGKDQELRLSSSLTFSQLSNLQSQLHLLKSKSQTEHEQTTNLKKLLEQKDTDYKQLQYTHARQLSNIQTVCDSRVQSLQQQLVHINNLFSSKQKQLQRIIIHKQQQLLKHFSHIEQNTLLQQQLSNLHLKDQQNEAKIQTLERVIQEKEHHLSELTQTHTKELKKVLETQEEDVKIMEGVLEEVRGKLEQKEREYREGMGRKEQEMESYGKTITAEIDTMQGFTRMLKEELAARNGQIAQQQKIIEHQQQEIDDYVNTRQTHQSTLSLQAQLCSTQQSLLTKQSQLVNLTQALSAKSSQLASLRSTLQCQHQSLLYQLQQKSHALVTTQHELQQHLNRVNYLTSQVEILTNTKIQSQKLSQELTRVNQNKDQQIRELREEMEREKERWAREVEEERRRKEKEGESAVEGKLREKGKEVLILKGEMGQMKRQFDDLTLHHNRLTREHHELRQSVHTLQQQLLHSRNTTHTLSLQLSVAKQSSVELSSKIRQLQQAYQRDLRKSGIISQNQQTIQQLQTKIQSLSEHNRNVNSELSSSRVRCEEHLRVIAEKERVIKNKQEVISEVEVYYQREIEKMKGEMERWGKTERHADQGNMVEMLQKKLRQQERDYDQIVNNLKQQLRARSLQDLSKRSSSSNLELTTLALKNQTDELSLLRSELKKRSGQLQSLKTTLISTKTQLTNLKSMYEIEKAKSMSEKNSSSAAKDNEIMNLKHDIQLEKRNNEAAAQKLKYLAEENKKKDGFIQNYLVGRKWEGGEGEMVKGFFRKYQEEFPIEKIKANMFKEFTEIQRLMKRNQELTEELTSRSTSQKTEESKEEA